MVFQASHPVTFLDYHRVPYEIVPDHSELPFLGSIRPVGHDGHGRRLLWVRADARAELDGSCVVGRHRLGDSWLVGQVARDSAVLQWLQRVGSAWRPTEAIRDVTGTHVASVWRDRHGSVLLPFDLGQVMENCWSERYREVIRRPRGGIPRTLLLRSYYAVKPVVPRPVQLALRRALAHRQGGSQFPRWPVEDSLHDLYRWYLDVLAEVRGSAVPWLDTWPGGRTWALVLTHDVESEAGCRDLHLLRDPERRAGYRSSWNFVPERYDVDPSLLQALKDDGCEIGVHGLRHDGRDLMTRRDFEERLPAVRTYAKQWDAVGYRSPATHRVWEWMPELGFDYDSSYTDTDPYEPQAGGCWSYLPFFNRDQVELPITLPQDHTLFAILGHTDGALWLDKARHIRDRGGMALALTHPDYARDPHLASAWQSLLEEFRDDDTAWRALPREVAEWWRRRAASVIRPGSNGWRIDGPAAIDGTVRLSSPPGQLTTQARGHEHSERRPGGDRAMQTRETQVHGAANDRAQATSPRSRGRICIVRHDHYLDLTVRREAEALRDAGYEVDVVCLPEHSGSPVEAGEGITLHRLPLRRRRGGSLAYVVDYVSFFVAATVTVARLHIQRPFLAVQANTMPDVLVFTALVPRLLGAKVVAFMKEPTPELGETKYGSRRLTHLLRRIEQAAIRFADMAFTVTEDLKETEVARGADAEKITVVLNGPDARYLLDHRTDAEPDPAWFTAVCHGLVDERYGHATMVRAIRLARERVPNLRLKITGRGEYGTRLQQLIEEEGVEDRVEYLGWLNLPELVDVLCRADVGIVAQESSPYSNLVHTNKMFEYMLLGKPVIASRLRSTARYFGDDAVEYFEAGSAESLAGALVALHDDPARRCRMVEAARAHYDAYGWDKQRDVYLSAYAALLGDDTAAVPTAGPRRGARGIARRLRRAWGSETTRQP